MSSRQLRVKEIQQGKDAPVVGSEEWAKMRKREDTPASSNRTIILSCSRGSWSHIKHAGFSSKAILSSSSHLAASVHKGPEKLFATAHDILEIRTATGHRVVSTKNVLQVKPR